MLEEFAFRVSSLSEVELIGISIGLYALGFFCALWIRGSSSWSIRRVPYFLLVAFISLAVSILSFGWLASVEAIKSGLLWLLMSSIFCGVVLAGFTYGVVSVARSVNGYGNGSSAWMGIIPIANLFLMFKAPHQSTGKPGLVMILGNIAGLILGFILLAFGQAVTKDLDRALDRQFQLAESDPGFRALQGKLLLESTGLEASLRLMAAEVSVGKIDDVTDLVRVEAQGKSLKYVYRLSSELGSIPADMTRRIILNNCQLEDMAPFIEAGATISHRYIRTDGSMVGTVEVTSKECRTPPEAIPQNTALGNIEQLIEKSPAGEMYNALKAYFPDDAEVFRREMKAAMENAENIEAASAKMLIVGQNIRKRHANNLRSAPDPSLWSVLQIQIQMIEAFKEDPLFCNRVVMHGPSVIPYERRQELTFLLDSANLLYKAMYEGRETPTRRQQPTQDDWIRFFDLFYETGGTAEELNLVLEPDIQNPKLCAGMYHFLQALVGAEFEGADRIRAEIAAAINES